MTEPLDQEVEVAYQAAIKWLIEYSEENTIYFRQSDNMIDGRVDIRGLVVAILEAK